MGKTKWLPGMATRVCGSCKTEKPIADYFKRKGIPKSQCRICERKYDYCKKQWYERNKEKHAAKNKEKYEKNKHQVLAQMKEYRLQNLEKLRAKAIKYAESHKAEISAYHKKHYLANADRLKAYQKMHKEMNPEYMLSYRQDPRNKERCKALYRESYQKNPIPFILRARSRDTKLKSLPGTFSKNQWDTLTNFFDNTCPCCALPTDKFFVDHIIPISWEGTSNWISNIQPLCNSCNSKKSNKNSNDYRPEHVRAWVESEMSVLV